MILNLILLSNDSSDVSLKKQVCLNFLKQVERAKRT